MLPLFRSSDKDKHIAHLIHLLLGKANTTAYTDEQLTPYIDFLNTHMIHLDMHEVPPTPETFCTGPIWYAAGSR